jgi:hypothetical protein
LKYRKNIGISIEISGFVCFCRVIFAVYSNTYTTYTIYIHYVLFWSSMLKKSAGAYFLRKYRKYRSAWMPAHTLPSKLVHACSMHALHACTACMPHACTACMQIGTNCMHAIEYSACMQWYSACMPIFCMHAMIFYMHANILHACNDIVWAIDNFWKYLSINYYLNYKNCAQVWVNLFY